jgi:uncharacterized phage protein gp47/JayE
MSAVMTNIPQIVWSTTGPVIPSDAAILAGVQADWQGACGPTLNLALNTPQGQLMQAQTAAISNAYALVTFIVNGMDPDMNSDFMQDVIGRIYFQNRNPGTPTVVSCIVSGQLGGKVIAGQPIASDSNGNLYAAQTAASIPVSGNVTVTFANTVNGPIACPAGSLKLNQAVSGIDSITNPADGVPGSNVEQRAAFEYRREQSVAANSNGPADAVYGAVIDLPGVTDAYVFENTSDGPITVGSTGYTLTPHSIFIGVIGGNPTDIGNAIRTKKGPGCDTNGNSSVTVTDPNYSYPQPSYTYKYNDNAENPATFNLTVNIVNSTALPGTIVQDVQAAVAAQFNGTLANSQRVRIGSLLLASSFVGPVAMCEGPSVPVSVLSIGIGSAFVGTGTVVNGSTTLTIVTATSASLTYGTPVIGTGLAAGAYIVQQLSGATGGVGTYQMSASATATEVSPVAITGAATGVSALVGIDQAPILGEVAVVLV